MGRFVAADSPAMDALVADAIAKIGAEIDAMRVTGLAGVVLGGGYGRGEGGVLVDEAGEHLSNDLDFFAVTEAGAAAQRLRAVEEALAPMSAYWTGRLGIDVDFVVRTPWRIRHDQDRVMIQELVHGYVDVAGATGEELFKDVARRPPDAFPWTEAVRLLVNRGMGLAMARENRDATFVTRNINKCVLGAGDATLIARHAYAWKATDRAAALGWPEYDAAVEWKFRPKAVAPCDWETARGIWLRTAEDVREEGRRSGADRRSLYQAARWVARRRTIGSLRTFGRGAVVRILDVLERVVRDRGAIPASLMEDWKMFN